MEGITVDSKFDAEAGRQGANRLVLADKVRFVLGTMNNDTAGAQAITEPAGVLLMPFSTIDKPLGSSFPLTLHAGYPYATMRTPVLYDYIAKENPNAKQVVILTSDDPNGRGGALASEAVIKAKGFTLAAQEFFPVNLKDFDPLATRVMRVKPDIIDMGGGSAVVDVVPGLATALRNQGFKG